MSKLPELFTKLAAQTRECASTLDAIAAEYGAAPPVIPPVVPPVIPPVTPPSGGNAPVGTFQFALTPGSSRPQPYNALVGVFSFIASAVGPTAPNGTTINTCYSSAYGGGVRPGNNVTMYVSEVPGGPVILTTGLVSNPDTESIIYTYEKTIPGQMYYLTIVRDALGGMVVQQTSK